MKRILLLYLFFCGSNSFAQDVEPRLMSDSLYHFVNILSQRVVDTNSWIEVEPFMNGVFKAFNADGFSFVDAKGKIATKRKYHSLRSVNFNRAAFCVNGKWGFMDSQCNELIAPEFDFVYDFHTFHSTFVIKNNQWYLIDSLGGILTQLNIDYSYGFVDGQAKVIHGDSTAFINEQGRIIGQGFVKNTNLSMSNKNISTTGRGISSSSSFCPPNLDFERGDFTNWSGYVGTINPTPVLNPGFSTSLSEIAINGNPFGLDPFGGFSTQSSDASPFNARLGKVGTPHRGAEMLTYEFTIPASDRDYTFMYRYALVLEDPCSSGFCGHSFSQKPRFKVQLFDLTSGQQIYCASEDYTADPSSAIGFLHSPADFFTYYKPWTPVFINLGRYAGHPMKLQFTNLDCPFGAHFAYSYIDIDQCGYSGLTGVNSCTVPVSTTLNAPTGFSNYLWSTHSNFSDTIGTTQHVVLPPGQGLPNNSTVFVQLIPIKGPVCSDTLNLNIVPATVKAIFDDQAPQCLNNNSYTFTSFSQAFGGTIANNHWDFGNATTDGNIVTHQFDTAGTIPVKLTTTTNEGCLDDTTINIIVKPSPKLQISGLNVCSGTASWVTLSGANNYTWSPRTGLQFPPLNTNYDSAYFPSNNTSTYTVRGTDTSSKCFKDTTFQIIFYPKPIADYVLPQPQCLRGNSFNFSNSSSISGGNIISYLWKFGDDSTSLLPSPNHSYDTAGVYKVQLYVESDKNCKDTVLHNIIVNAHPSSNIRASNSLTFCYKDSVILSATVSAGSGVITKYEWYKDGNLLVGQGNTQLRVDTTGIYYLVLTNSNGCEDKSLLQPIIAHPLPKGNIETQIPNVDYICNSEHTTLIVRGSTATNYQWYFTDINHTQPATPISGANTPTYEATQPGYYSLELKTSTIPSCKSFAEDTVTLRLIKKPILDFSYPVYCAGRVIPFANHSDTSASGSVHWSWNFGDLSANSNLFEPQHLYPIGSDYSITLSATPLLCPSLDTSIVKVVTVEHPISGIRYPDINAVQNSNTPLKARTFASKYNWVPSVGLNDPLIYNPIFNYNHETDYTIKLETDAGCITYDKQLVRIFYTSDIQVPTAFSPNLDGHNDKLDVFLIGIKQLNFFRVFNRWGQLLFETNDLKNRWDGRFNGVKQPIETYVWVAEAIDLNNKKIIKRGQFILLK